MSKATRTYTKYPIRTCKSLHFCEVCRGQIKYGDTYYDGGYGKRAHDLCADAEEMERAEAAKMAASNAEYDKGADEA